MHWHRPCLSNKTTGMRVLNTTYLAPSPQHSQERPQQTCCLQLKTLHKVKRKRYNNYCNGINLLSTPKEGRWGPKISHRTLSLPYFCSSSEGRKADQVIPEEKWLVRFWLKEAADFCIYFTSPAMAGAALPVYATSVPFPSLANPLNPDQGLPASAGTRGRRYNGRLLALVSSSWRCSFLHDE